MDANETRRTCGAGEGAGIPCPECGEAQGITVFGADTDAAEPGLACANGHECREDV